MSGFIRAFLSNQVWCSLQFERLMPAADRIDGNRFFLDMFAPTRVPDGALVIDIGGGKQPLFSPDEKRKRGLFVTGLDISYEELHSAPVGSYDQIIIADLCSFRGVGTFDIAVCQAVLEHVPNLIYALEGIHSLLKPGGRALIFTPCKNAPFARLNRRLPEWIKRRLLFAIYPHTKKAQGFPAYYDRCSPREFCAAARAVGFTVIECLPFYCSAYFRFFFPFHLLWRLSVFVRRAMIGLEAAETFVVEIEKHKSL